MSETVAALKKLASDVDAARAEAAGEIDRAGRAIDAEVRGEVVELLDRLEKWRDDATRALDEGTDEFRSKVTAFGDELLHDLKMARERM